MNSGSSRSVRKHLDVAAVNHNYELGAQNVRARFRLYDYVTYEGEVQGDISQFAIDTLREIGHLPLQATVLDVGASDAKELDYLRIEVGHTGPLYGIDPNPRQFMSYDHLTFSDDDIAKLPETFDEHFRSDRLKGPMDQDIPLWEPNDNLVLQEGRAQDLHAFETSSIDDLFAFFMLYHVGQTDRPKAFSEFVRVLKPDGVTAITTSGDDNKYRHRQMEEILSDTLRVTAPPHMNTGFTTAKAAFELPHYWQHVYQLDQIGTMSIETPEQINAYLQSIRSLYDQYTPIPPEPLFESYLHSVVGRIIEDDIYKKGVFKDTVHRSLFFGSDVALDLPSSYGFTEISN